MPIKQYTVFRCLLPLSAKYWFKQFYKTILHYSHIKPPRKDTERIHHMLIQVQTLCVDSALRLKLTKGTYNQRRTNFACSIVSLDICLLLTKITRDYAQKRIFYRQFFICYSFSNCTVCVSFFVGYTMVNSIVCTFLLIQQFETLVMARGQVNFSSPDKDCTALV